MASTIGYLAKQDGSSCPLGSRVRRPRGTIILSGFLGTFFAVLAVLGLIEAASVLYAARRVQAGADAAALAAVVGLDESPGNARRAALRQADAAGVNLIECRCRRLPVQVRTSAPVPGPLRRYRPNWIMQGTATATDVNR